MLAQQRESVLTLSIDYQFDLNFSNKSQVNSSAMMIAMMMHVAMIACDQPLAFCWSLVSINIVSKEE